MLLLYVAVGMSAAVLYVAVGMSAAVLYVDVGMSAAVVCGCRYECCCCMWL